MKGILLTQLMIFFLLFPFICRSQWQWQNPLLQGNDLNDVFFIDQTNGWAVGNAGTIMKSTDGGMTYALINYPTHLNLTSVEFFNADTGLVTGESGIILKTTDGGLTWNQIDVEITAYITDLCFINSTIAWISIGNGKIYRSIDYGDSWNLVFSDSLQKFNSICFIDVNHGWVAGYNSDYYAELLRTWDGGETWSNPDFPFGDGCGILDVCFTDTLTGYASITMGCGYSLVKTTNGGESWQGILDDFYYGAFNDIKFTDRYHGWIVGDANFSSSDHGNNYFTLNGGMTWNVGEISNDPIYDEFNAVYFTDDFTGWMAGPSGHALYSTDGGAHWTNIYSGYNGHNNLEDVFFTDSQNGWASGAFLTDESRVLHTSDGGASWTPQAALDHMLSSIFFIDPLEGWMIGMRSFASVTTAIYHTVNGGEEWEMQLSMYTDDGDFSDIIFLDSEHGWAVGGGGYSIPPENVSLLYYTADGGKHWIDRSKEFNHALFSVCFIDDETGFISGHKTILRTDDGGDKWTEIWSGPHCFRDIFFTDSNHGWAIGDSASRYPYHDVIMRTADGGETWEEQYPGFGSDNKKLFFVDNDNGWIARDDGDILYTINGGVTWQHMFINFNGFLGGIFFTDIDHGWAVGENEAIFHISNGSIVGVSEQQSRDSVSKFQVNCYPNPTSGISHFSFLISQPQWVTLMVYDLNGRETALVLDENFQAGKHDVIWDASNLPPGIYFYQIKTKGDGPYGMGKLLKY